MYRILCAACLLLFLSPAYTQDFIYKHYDLQDGLANSTVHSIFQDNDGFLWFGTESGLCRYDGTQFKTFTVKDGLPDNEVLGMLQDHKGRIWLQLYKNAIAYIYKGKIYNQENDPLLKKIKMTNRTYDMAQDSEGNVGFCTLDGIHIIRMDNTIRTIDSMDRKPARAYQLYKDDDGKLVVCSDFNLYKIENYGLKYLKTLSSYPNRLYGPSSALLHPNFRVIRFYDSIYLKDTTLYYKLPEKVFKYSPLSDSTFSINTANGAFIFNKNTYQVKKILPGIRVTNIFIDKEKNMWIGTESQGLYKLGSSEIVNKKIGENQNDIFYIKKEKNKIIIANNNGRIYEFNGNGFTRIILPYLLDWDMRIVLHYEKLSEHKEFLAHHDGLFIQENNKVITTPSMIMLKGISPVDSNHFLGAAHDGVFLINKNNARSVDTIWERKSLCAFKTNDSVFIGALSGLFILKEKNGGYTIVDSLLQTFSIRFVQKSENGLVWVGTAGNGLYCMKHGKLFRHFTDSLELPSNNCRKLYIEGDKVWVGTDKGLARITMEKENFHTRTYSMSDGLPSNIINSIYVDGNIIYIGTPEGLCYFDESVIETTSICNLVLTGIKVGDKYLELNGNYSLNSRQRFVIEYSGISFRSEQEMIYRYRINGIDDKWQTTTLNSLEFTSLPYGDYGLEVVAINKFGKESPPLKVQFHIERPFHKTTWFIILLVLLPVAMILFYINYRVHLSKRRQMQNLRQEMRMVELEQMALRAQMNPHFIFNCINAIQQLITEKDTANVHRFVASFSDLIRRTLDNAPELQIPLNEEIKFLTSYLELERIRLEDRFNYTIQTTGVQHPDRWQVPNMVIQPFVENAILHGIRYKEDGKGKIELEFEELNSTLRCTVTDNGIGREKSEQIKTELGINRSSKGMGITFQRILSLNTISDGAIDVTIEDMKDGVQNASGTKVIIDFHKNPQS